MEKTVHQVAGIEAMVKSLRYRHRWLNYMDPLYWLSNFRKRDQLFKYLSSLHKNDWASPWKVCVVPHSFKQLQRNPKGRKFLDPKSTTDTSSSSFDRGYIVYIYDDYEGKFKKKLNLSLPAWVVGKTLKLLLDRKIKADNQTAQEIENDINSTNFEGSLQSRLRQSVMFSDKVETTEVKDSDLESLSKTFAMPTNSTSKKSRKVSTASNLIQIDEEENSDKNDTTINITPETLTTIISALTKWKQTMKSTSTTNL